MKAQYGNRIAMQIVNHSTGGKSKAMILFNQNVAIIIWLPPVNFLSLSAAW